MLRIRIESIAEKQIFKLPKLEQKRVVVKISALAYDPKPAGSLKIAGSASKWRIRVGDYRVIYELDEQENSVRIWRVKHRREAYR